MSEATKIEWATSTGNPWIGCTKVSPGCKNCYAETLDRQRFSRTMGGGTKEKPVSHWGPGAPRFRTKGFWRDAVKWNDYAPMLCPDCQGELKVDKAQRGSGIPLAVGMCSCGSSNPPKNRVRPRIFPSLCDWLDDEVPIEWLADFLKLIHDTPNLDWLLLTKRPENFDKRLYGAGVHFWNTPKAQSEFDFVTGWLEAKKAPANVWIGTSVEDQQRADERIPELLKIPAKVRFLSVEPMLGPVKLKLNAINYDRMLRGPCSTEPAIHWVIVGGESGPGARPCQAEWIRDVVSQCRSAGVPCFVKQLGSFPVMGREDAQIIRHAKGGEPSEWPSDLRVREFPQ